MQSDQNQTLLSFKVIPCPLQRLIPRAHSLAHVQSASSHTFKASLQTSCLRRQGLGLGHTVLMLQGHAPTFTSRMMNCMHPFRLHTHPHLAPSQRETVACRTAAVSLQTNCLRRQGLGLGHTALMPQERCSAVPLACACLGVHPGGCARPPVWQNVKRGRGIIKREAVFSAWG